MEIFRGGEMPKPQFMYQATVQSTHAAALHNATRLYTRGMVSIIASSSWYLSSSTLADQHRKLRIQAIEFYKNTPKMDFSLTEEYKRKLSEEIDQMYTEIREQRNNSSILPRAFSEATERVSTGLRTYELCYMFYCCAAKRRYSSV